MTNFDFEKISIEQAAKELKDPKPDADALDWKTLRGAPPSAANNLLDPETRVWLGSLPKDVRPNWLVKHYPRIANRLAQSWTRRAVCQKYLDELAFDHRGGRAGFPKSVAFEIASLRSYFDSTKVEARGDIWNNDQPR